MLYAFLWRVQVRRLGGGRAVSAVVGAESMLGWVEHVLGFPCGADAVGEYAGP